MVAYKFLRPGAVGPFSGVRWPAADAGAWVESAGGPATCAAGVHACRVTDLPRWIAEELWAVELRGPVVEGPLKLVAPAGRLVRRVTAWDADAARSFTRECAARVDALAGGEPALRGYADDIERHCLAAAVPQRGAAVAQLVAAEAAYQSGGDAAVAREREAQVAWFRAMVI